MELKYMQIEDKDFVMGIDSHVNELQYENRVHTKTGYVMWDDDERVGLMHYSVLWDNLPFLNLIHVEKKYRNKGFATKAMELWEEDMKNQGYKMILTPFEQPMEMFMRKVL